MVLKYNYDINIDVARDGKSCILMFKKDLAKTCCSVKYKMILMDLHMPSMDGYSTAKEIFDTEKK